MTSVLGIDAAWTATEPSGVALIRKNPDGGRWEFVALAPSYDAFIATANGVSVGWDESLSAGRPDPERLLMAAERLLVGERVSVISVDMPMSRVPINGRRKADGDISRKFGAMGCSTHSPNSARPGVISTALLERLFALGYELATEDSSDSNRFNSVIEVYPHPALLRLLGRDFRVPYKTNRTNRYWPKSNLRDRANLLIDEFRGIYAGLAEVVCGINDFLPKRPYEGSLTSLKRYEDALDALVCAWVGAQYLEGIAMAYGDSTAAIWVPESK